MSRPTLAEIFESPEFKELDRSERDKLRTAHQTIQQQAFDLRLLAELSDNPADAAIKHNEADILLLSVEILKKYS